jgi:hypothetical protein
MTTIQSMAMKMKEVRSRSRLTSRDEALTQFRVVEDFLRTHPSQLSLRPSGDLLKSKAGGVISNS